MAEYAYRAATTDGGFVDGRLSAASREEALRQLRGQGLTPVRLEESGEETAQGGACATTAVKSIARPRLLSRPKRPGFAEVHALTAELSVMLRAGLPLDRALRVLIGMSGNPAVVAVIEDLLKSVKAGKGLSQALAAHQPLFGDFYISMVRSGEAGGQLAAVLAQLAEHLERVKALRESVISALIYPAILVVVAALSVILLLGFVVPQFETLFDDLGDGLPLPTRIIVSAGHLVADWGWLLALLAVAAVLLARRWLASPGGRLRRDDWLLRTPVLGTIARKYEITRFARSMGTLLGNGVPIVTALRIASDTMGNQCLRSAIDSVAPAIKQGGRMADALERSGLFTLLALNMVRLGEETGRLDAMLLEVARVHDAEVQAGVKRALTLVEPALILTLGVVIAAIIVSILMGILSVNELAL
ncbi:MAG: type II secretion system F family protein [Rhodocyclaceae bacterium]|nr:type II secretion system F family protein [Rhodocyclaceae bacterium]